MNYPPTKEQRMSSVTFCDGLLVSQNIALFVFDFHQTQAGLTSSPRAIPVIPTVKIFLAAFISLS